MPSRVATGNLFPFYRFEQSNPDRFCCFEQSNPDRVSGGESNQLARYLEQRLVQPATRPAAH